MTDERPAWEPRSLRCRCGVAADQWAPSTAMRRHLRRLYADADGLLPACPACDDRCEHVETREHISLSMRSLEEGADDARLPREERLADRIAEVASDD